MKQYNIGKSESSSERKNNICGVCRKLINIIILAIFIIIKIKAYKKRKKKQCLSLLPVSFAIKIKW